MYVTGVPRDGASFDAMVVGRHSATLRVAARSGAVPRQGFPRVTGPCVLRAALLVAAVVGCGAGSRARARWPDAPVQLRHDGDRDAAIDRLWTMPPGGDRDRERDRIASAIARRIADAIDDDRPYVAAELLDQLTSLWQSDPAAIGRGLAP